MGQSETTDIGDQVKIELKDGSVIYGSIVNQTGNNLEVQSDSFGKIEVEISDIKKIDVLKKEQSEKDQKGNSIDYHNSTHYFVAPSAYSLKKGQSYYENIGIFWNSYTTGITDNFSLSLGGEIISLLFAANFPIVYVSPKYSIPFENESGAFAVTATAFTTPEDDFNTYGFITGSLTFGNRNTNLTIGSGIGFSSIDGFENEVVPFNFSTMIRIGPKMSFLSENWIIMDEGFNDSFGILSAGLRLHFKNSGSALNVGLWRVTEDMGSVIGIPFVSGTVAIK
ncbi:MAG: hypothetical protein KJO50_06305 [Bacteroidia bacterium]|nr:hypothetical protein [Bacteroidia bacterium]